MMMEVWVTNDDGGVVTNDDGGVLSQHTQVVLH